MISSEGHTHCTRKNSSVVVNPFTDNTEVLLNSTIVAVNPFINNNINTIIPSLPLDTTDISSPPLDIIPTPPEPPPTPTTKPDITIRVYANNIIIHTNRDLSTSTPEIDISPFTLQAKVLYKGTRATIVNIIRQDDEFLEPLFKIQNRLGKTKIVGHVDLVEDLLAVPSDISFATKASGEMPDDNSFVTSDSNSFVISKQSKGSKSSIAREDYLLQLEKKIVHNNYLLTTLLYSAKISSIDEITEPSTNYKSIDTTLHNQHTSKTTFSSNKSIHNPSSVEMVDTNHSNELDMITLSTVIACAVANANTTKILRLPPFTLSDTKLWLHSIIIQLSYTTFFTALLNADQSFVSINNANKNPTVDAVLYTQLSKTIPTITMNILNPDSTSKSGVAILVLLQAKISMSKTPNDIDILYRNWCNMAKGKNESVEDYTARDVQLKKDLFGTEKEIKQPEFVRKWR